MSQPAKAREPSMEEILASIRRIIADDSAAKSTAAPSPATEAVKPIRMSAAPSAKPSPSLARTTPATDAAPAPSIAPVASTTNSQDDIDALFATFDDADASDPEPELPSPSPSPRDTRALPSRTADILDLTEEMRTPVPPPSTFRKVEAQSDVVFTDVDEESGQAPEPVPEHRFSSRPRAGETTKTGRPDASVDAAMDEPELMSTSTKAAVDSAFNALAQTVLVQNARTLEDLVREMLRPMLKAWLDENLPHMVERLVRAEIERVSRGRS